MAENKELGLDSLKGVDWLNDSAPAPEVAPEATEESQEPETKESSEKEVEAAAPEEAVETTSEVEEPVDAPEEPEQEPVAAPAQDAEEEPGVIQTLSQRLGYDIEGEFADDYDGLTQYTSAVASKIAEEQLGEIFNQYPDVREYFQYRANNGDPLKYFQAQQAEMDYGSMTIDDNTAVQRRVVQDGMRSQGFGDEEITKMMDSYEDAGILKDNAEIYLAHLQRHQVNRKEELLQEQQKQAEAQRAQADAYWKQVSDTVQTGQLKGLQIPTKQRKQFYNWMTLPVDQNGATQRDLDRSKLDTETALALEYLIYQGFDLSKLSRNVAKTKNTQSLKNRLQSAPSASTRMKSRSKSTVTKAAPLPSLRDLL
tara:strand:+ start:809 stop:1912 length:1104 start_codon:yes stop_codon:yes gene_type:complete